MAKSDMKEDLKMMKEESKMEMPKKSSKRGKGKLAKPNC